MARAWQGGWPEQSNMPEQVHQNIALMIDIIHFSCLGVLLLCLICLWDFSPIEAQRIQKSIWKGLVAISCRRPFCWRTHFLSGLAEVTLQHSRCCHWWFILSWYVVPFGLCWRRQREAASLQMAVPKKTDNFLKKESQAEQNWHVIR